MKVFFLDILFPFTRFPALFKTAGPHTLPSLYSFSLTPASDRDTDHAPPQTSQNKLMTLLCILALPANVAAGSGSGCYRRTLQSPRPAATFATRPSELGGERPRHAVLVTVRTRPKCAVKCHLKGAPIEWNTFSRRKILKSKHLKRETKLS